MTLAVHARTPPAPLLRYRAGPRALALLRRRGLAPGVVRAVVGPASGPRWLGLVGIDRALLESGLLRRGPILLVGASAGAWRMLAFACRDPLAAHQRLLDGYVGQVFRRGVSAPEVSAAYRDVLAEVVADAAAHAVAHPEYDLAVHTARLRGGRSRGALMAALGAAAALSPFTPAAAGWLFERVLFHSRPERLTVPFAGRVVPLRPDNLLPAALASGTVPIYLAPVGDPPGAPAGAYFDGGLTDYHLAQQYLADGPDHAGVVLFPHYQRDITPGWFDKRRPRRRPAPAALTDLLQLYPSAAFFDRLPDRRLPDRDDFQRFVDDPAARLRRWHAVAAAAEALGEELLRDLEAGRLPDLVEPL